jgi:hypothetical protein
MKLVIIENSTCNIFNFRLNLIEEFIRIGYEVVVVSPEDKYLNKLKSYKISYNNNLN